MNSRESKRITLSGNTVAEGSRELEMFIPLIDDEEF